MTALPLTVECPVPPSQRSRASGLDHAAIGDGSHPCLPAGRVPRVARLMALALRLEQLVRSGAIRNDAELARLGHVSRARISQIRNLLVLAPDIQEALLFLPRTERGRDPVSLRQLQPLTTLLDWGEQRQRWQALRANRQLGQPR
jgi:hypothetical protein